MIVLFFYLDEETLHDKLHINKTAIVSKIKQVGTPFDWMNYYEEYEYEYEYEFNMSAYEYEFKDEYEYEHESIEAPGRPWTYFSFNYNNQLLLVK